jgi:hypothetical protein
MRGVACAMHSNACQRLHRLKTTKPCCRGTAHPHRLAERASHIKFGAVYRALSVFFRLALIQVVSKLSERCESDNTETDRDVGALVDRGTDLAAERS